MDGKSNRRLGQPMTWDDVAPPNLEQLAARYTPPAEGSVRSTQTVEQVYSSLTTETLQQRMARLEKLLPPDPSTLV